MTEIKIKTSSAGEEDQAAKKQPEEKTEEAVEVLEETCPGAGVEEADQDPPPEELSEEEKTYKEQLQRLAADFDNYRRRVTKEKALQYDCGVISLARKILPVLDSLDLAVAAAQSSHGAEDSFLKGIEMVQRMLTDTLTQMQITRIDATGGAFNPRLHEALLTQPDDDVPPDTILQELQPGYLYKDQLLRAAKVKISAEVQTSGNGKDKPDTPN